MNQFNKNLWTAIYIKNLTTHSDPNFKLARLIESNDGSLLFDLRQTTKGKMLTKGFSLIVSEFKWFKKVILSMDQNIYHLEHNNRLLTINKKCDDISIIFKKSNGNINHFQIGQIEVENLKQHLDEIEQKFVKRAKELYLSTDFAECTFYLETIE